MAIDDSISSRRLGAALRRARTSAGLSRRVTASRAGCSPRQVREWERGDALPDDAQLERLALACSHQTEELLPDRDAAPVTVADGHLTVSGTTTPLPSDEPLTDEVLRSYLDMVYELRETKPGDRIPLRDDDVDILAASLGSDPDLVGTRLVELMDVTREEASALRAALLRRRVLVPAAGIALGATMVMGGTKLVSGNANPAAHVAVDGAADGADGAGNRIVIGTAANVTAPEIGDAAVVTADVAPEAAPAEASVPVEVDAAPGDPAYVERDPAATAIPVVIDAAPGDPAYVERAATPPTIPVIVDAEPGDPASVERDV